MIDKIELTKIKETLPSTVKLVAVSKFIPNEAILEAYNLGIRDFGESRPQELLLKMEQLPDDIRWHFIGHLQSNKIKMIIDKVYMIHSVDSLKLLEAINREGAKRDIKVNVLLQLHIAQEESKQGLTIEELWSIIGQYNNYSNINFCGMMGMATFTDKKEVIEREFALIHSQFNEIKSKYPQLTDFTELSIGMSGDYPIAIEHGSTMVRVGTAIFGGRV